jgi:diacylglycerol O-acyltransferase
MQAVPLGPEDRAILALECDTVLGHTCKVVLVERGGPDLGALRAAVSERLGAVPALTRRLAGSPDAPAWADDDEFDVARHVVQAPVEAPLDREGLRAEVARLFEQRLNRAHPLWRMDTLPLEGGRTALVWRIHHALADGTTAMRYARALLWDPGTGEAQQAGRTRGSTLGAGNRRSAEPGGAASGGAPQAAAERARDDARRREHLAGFIHREFARSRGRSPFDGRIGTTRRLAFASVPLRDLHDAAKELDGATLNDAVLACVAGALRRWVEHHHGRLGAIRVKVPVSLHHEGDDVLNRDSFFSLGLPLAEPDPVKRLRSVHAATAVRKAEHDAERLDTLARDLARVSPHLRDFCERLERSPRRFAVNVSNVPGPRAPVTILGTPVEALYSVAEIGEHHALRVAVVSLAGRLCFGFCADPGIVDDIQAMSTGVEREADALIAAAGASA